MLSLRYRLGGSVVFLGFALSLAVAGCSSQGTISGKVTYQGKLVTVGTVLFVPEQGGGAVTSEIRDGQYQVTKVPPGPAKIAVYTPSESGPASQFMMKMQPPAEVLQKVGKSPEEFSKPSEAPRLVPVPKKFHDPNTSGLTYTVKGGTQVHDIELPAN